MLATNVDEVLAQPIAAFASLAGGIAIRGRVRGAGLVVVRDGAGGRAATSVGSSDSREPVEFEIRGADLERAFGRPIVPRLTLELRCREGEARWSELQALVPLPCPSESALRAEIIDEIDRIVRTWVERGSDDLGQRPTRLFCRGIDPLTGNTIVVAAGGLAPLCEELLRATAVEPRESWIAALEAYLDDYFALCFYPDTGLPRDWDCEQDLPQDAKPIEIARHLAFLLDLAERGPERFRERALAASQKIGATVLEKGVLPDGSIAAKYLPSTGAPQLDVPALRYLDVAAQIARLATVAQDARMLDAARAAVAQVEYTLFWGGSWKTIDPDFDDSFGHWGARCVRMAEFQPGETLLRRFVATGFEHFAPLWSDALAFGGSVAADQARCWVLLLDYARVEPKIAPELAPLVRSALRAHFKGEQYDTGAWGDVTFFDFAPRAGLDVGDFSGYPSNLVWGLARAYARDSGLRSDELRAMYTAVLRSSRTAYRREYGWLRTRGELASNNPPGGDLRVLLGLVEMLVAL
jgi:hypothetical protein